MLDYAPPGKTDTSREAAAKINLSRNRKMVLAALTRPRTCSEIADSLGLDKTSIRPRATELHQNGYITDTGEHRLNKFGNNEIVWRKN